MLGAFQPLLSLLPYFLILFLVASTFRLLKFQLNKKDINNLPYAGVKSVMTSAEQKYFRQLEQQYGQEYYIFPQVKLDKIIKTTDKKNFYTYWNKINKKSIDFVLVDKQTLQTVKLIELNDRTHTYKKRVERDNFLGKVCEKAEVDIEFI